MRLPDDYGMNLKNFLRSGSLKQEEMFAGSKDVEVGTLLIVPLK